jgi:hypothetical protein
MLKYSQIKCDMESIVGVEYLILHQKKIKYIIQFSSLTYQVPTLQIKSVSGVQH